MKQRGYAPVMRVIIPVVENTPPTTALQAARSLKARVQLVGIVRVPPEASLTSGTSAARRLRRQMQDLRGNLAAAGQDRVLVSYEPWKDLCQALQSDPTSLLILEWPSNGDVFSISAERAFSEAPCQVALMRGPWPEKPLRVLAPVRGGPNAELVLRFALALPSHTATALHLSHPGASLAEEEPFRGLNSVLPRLSGVKFEVTETNDPVGVILERACQADVLLIGASGTSGSSAAVFFSRIIKESVPAVVFLRTDRPLPVQWSGPEGQRAGSQAISLLVDRWFAENTYHADEFDDLERLVRLKKEQKLTISLALPALNEEETVGEVIRTCRDALQFGVPLLDEIVLMDSDSNDRTREIARELGIPVFIHQQVLPAYGARAGKGEALWKSLQMTHGDIVVWIDTDIVNIHPHFVYGVIGPLLINPSLQLVKGFYQRPLRTGEGLQAGGGGRVTELTARPLLNLFYPELSGLIQPLSGEYGGRRTALEKCSFFSGYGVEIGLLIDMFEKFGLESIAQVDLLERIHHNQSLEALSKMSFTILQAVIRKLESRQRLPILDEVNKTMKLICSEEGSYYLRVEEVVERERPPMLEIPEYILEHKHSEITENKRL
jgi:hypothetical protein